MGKGLRHIDFILLLLFGIPTVYQPVHLIQHNSAKAHACFSGIYHAGEKPGFPIVQANRHCLICEYKFTVTDLPAKFNIPFTELRFNELKQDNIQDRSFFEVIFQISPRAPPFFHRHPLFIF